MNRRKFNPLILGIPLIVSLLAISVGFAAMSTSLSINGGVSFVPVGLIRILSFRQDSLTGVSEISKSFDADVISTLVDFDDLTGTAIYDVNVTNLGETDKMLSRVTEMIFSNDDMEYELIGFTTGDIIRAKGSVDFKIKFKYKDGVTNPETNRLNAKIKFVFEDYVKEDIEDLLFPIVFKQEGACTFNGSTAFITGEECTKYADKYYIDTGINLYDSENYRKDYEIGFTIIEYDPTNQVGDQVVFVNTKKEIGQGQLAPGLVVRKRATSNKEIEIAQYIKANKTITVPIAGTRKIKVVRKSNVVYYSVNDGELIQLQDASNFDNPYTLSTWFGAAPDVNGNQMRNIKATLSNMYIRLGESHPLKRIVTFNAMGGNLGVTTRQVVEYEAVGSLPIPTNSSDKIFEGWFADENYQTPVDENTIVYSDTTYYAKWKSMGVEVNGNYYDSLTDAFNNIDFAGGQVTFRVLNNESCELTIPAGADVVIDLNNHSLSNKTKYSTIINHGNLKILNGTVATASNDNAAINNEQDGILEISGVSVTATGVKQCLYNNGGTVTITNNSYFNSASTTRAAVHNLNNGTMNIISATIISTGQAGINNVSTMTIGVKDGSVDLTTPIIQAKTQGIVSTANFSFYDGIVKAQSGVVSNMSKLVDKEDGSEIVNGTENIDGVTYNTMYLSLPEPEPEPESSPETTPETTPEPESSPEETSET